MAKKTRRQSRHHQLAREAALLEARLAHPAVTDALESVSTRARELHAAGSNEWNDTKPGTRHSPFGEEKRRCLEHGVRFIVVPDARGDPEVTPSLAERPGGIQFNPVPSLRAPGDPFATWVSIEVDTSKPDADLRAEFDQFLIDLRGGRVAVVGMELRRPRRMSPAQVRRGARAYLARSAGLDWEAVGRQVGLGRTAASRLAARFAKDYGLPPLTMGGPAKMKPAATYCAKCPDGGCIGCALAAAVAEVEVPLKERLA